MIHKSAGILSFEIWIGKERYYRLSIRLLSLQLVKVHTDSIKKFYGRHYIRNI